MGRSNRPKPARLAEKLLQIRRAFGLSLQGIIQRLDYTTSPLRPQNVSGFETGEREPPLQLLLAYARLCGISTDVLIDDDLDLPAKLPCSLKHPGIPRQKIRGKLKINK